MKPLAFFLGWQGQRKALQWLLNFQENKEHNDQGMEPRTKDIMCFC